MSVTGHRRPLYGLAKRLFDVCAAAILLLLLLPLFLAIAIAILLTMGRPVFFRQRRPGRNGGLFTLLKFRSMRAGAETPAPDESRLTGLGRLLRRTSLDELPELFNVVRGDMSLVGPRPLLPQYLERYSPEQMRRHDVPPGITGWAQVNGRNELDWAERFRLDLWYVDHASFGLDLRILAKTIGMVVRGEGISARGHATMPEFEGTRQNR
jgi:sugar transferase EpsL